MISPRTPLWRAVPKEMRVTHLLIVEDHALVREGLVQTLHKLGADVVLHEAPDAETALRVHTLVSAFSIDAFTASEWLANFCSYRYICAST